MTITIPETAAPVWLVGCGNMGGAMLRGWLKNGLQAAMVTVIDPAVKDVPAGVTLLTTVPEVVPPPATLLVAVKPQSLAALAPALAPAVGSETLVLSILAGVETETLAGRLGAKAIVRAMPNTPAAIGQGMTVLFARGTSDKQRETAQALMSALGSVAWIEDEAQFDAVTALSGSGPAYVFRFIDSLAEAGIALGLDPALATQLAVETVAGAAELARQSPESAAILADRVASPGGTTREGLNQLDAADGIRSLLVKTLEAAAKRSRELAEAARNQA